ncbi:hypothetical protein [Mycolicibacterium elephantis]|nr:hypothetical protein [Mycolicibacterium elephantis]
MEIIDSELRLLAAVRRVAAEYGGMPSIDLIDNLLRERNLSWGRIKHHD